MNPNNPQYTEVKFNEDAQNAIYQGVHEVAEAVATTLGPLGRNVLIDRGHENSILHDGVSVANAINPQEPFRRNGAKVIQEAAKKQRDEVGDGTTAVMVLSDAIVREARKVIAAGNNPMTLRRGLESGAKKVIDVIESASIPVRRAEQKKQIATVSANSEELGKLIADTIQDVGDEGVITVDDSKASETIVEKQDGMQVDKGYAHQYMITEAERKLAIIDDCHVLVTDMPLNDMTHIKNYLENIVIPNTKKVLFVSPEIGMDFIVPLLGAKMSGQFIGLAMRAPGLATQQTEILQDICALTGAMFISKDAHKFEDLTFEALGSAARVIQSKTSTIIEGGRGNKRDIQRRITTIKNDMDEEGISDYEMEQLKGRLAKLTNGVAVIRVGGQTDVEMKDRKERVIDAVQATQAACRYGLVPGGEVIYLSALSQLDDNIIGERILKDVLKAPFKRLVENAGYDSGQLLSELMRKPRGEGYDVVTGEFKDMIKAGIVDPTAVPVNAIKNAVSVATQLSSLGAAVVIKNEEK